MTQWRGVDAAVIQKLTQARRRLVLNEFLRHLPWALGFGVSLLALLLGGLLAAGSLARLDRAAILCALGVPLAAAALRAGWRWRSTSEVASEVDRCAQTKDRFSTFLNLSEAGASEFGQLSAREIQAYTASLQVERAIRVRLPGRNFLWVLLPVLGVAALLSVGHSRRAAVAPEQGRAARMLKQAHDALVRQPVPDPAAIKDIEKAMERVQNSADPWKEALGALADLENHLAAEQSNSSGLTPEEAEALAAAVAKANPGLAQQLRAGDQGGAAQEMSNMDPDAVKKAMAEAAEHLKSNRMRDLAKQAANEAQRSLAKIMRSSGGSSDGTGEGKQRVASAIQDAKNDAMGDRSSPGENGQGEAPGNAPNGKNPAGGKADDSSPGGTANSEKDLTKGKDIDGQRDPQPPADSQEQTLAGIEASGASVVETYRAAGNDQAKARDYREMHRAATAAALDSVNHEEIPAGSRLLVKRYFESIRPAE